MGVRRHLGGFAHQGQLGRGLIQAQFVQPMPQRQKFLGCDAAATRFTQPPQPAQEPSIEFGLPAKMAVNMAAIFDHPWQDVIDVVDREGIVQPVFVHRTDGAYALAMPALVIRSAFAAEQHGLAMPAMGQ
ncbi:hypothetical protein RF55_18269 [Lasius niger]|uniref:Uncharacterized protein n=1 Tax=Lasius niger TaxID=67767 RepID=A0A0J7K1H1_LASNI|nr:hypothetical protein RF55_18269 [Lasius niger]